jgi:hypothetical protein
LPADACKWAPEQIGDDESLFRRIPRVYFKSDGSISEKVFMRNAGPRGTKKEPDPEISTDWARYSSPEESRSRAVRPSENGVGSISAGFPRHLGLLVQHTPDHERRNRAHATIFNNRGLTSKQRCRELTDELERSIIIWPDGMAAPHERS